MDARLKIVQGDITRQSVDVIVNAANESLLPGGGVDGAVHRAAGPGLLEETRALGGCPTGQARITGAHKLPARWVVHAVGPVWRGGRSGEDGLLASAYRASLDLATEKGARSIAFPLISAGAYGFPLRRAVTVALRAIDAYLTRNRELDEVRLVCYSREAHEECLAAAETLFP